MKTVRNGGRKAGGWLGGAALALALLAAGPARAQKLARYKEVTFSAGYGVAVVQWPTMQQFLDSYHQVNAADLRSKLTLDPFPVLSVAVNAGNFAAVRYEHMGAERTAEFTTGTKRHLRIRQSLLLVAVEPAWRKGRFLFGPTFGMGGGSVVASSSYQYADGTRSWGNERQLNGTFGGTTLTTFAGLRLALHLKRAALTFRAERVNTGLSNTQLDDDVPGGAFDGLPRDYQAYLNNYTTPGSYSAVDNTVETDLVSYRFSLQLGVRLNPAD